MSEAHPSVVPPKLPLSAVYHVLPIDDAMEHREGMDCPCCPRLELAGVNNGVVVHNAFDGRVDSVAATVKEPYE